jgi:hypothetical protein
LAVGGFLAAGAGHGSSALMTLSAQPIIYPIGLIVVLTQSDKSAWGISLILAAPVLLWTSVGILLGCVHNRIARALFLATMTAHYVSQIIVVCGPRSIWGHFERVAWLVIGVAVFFLATQIVIWIAFVIIVRHPTTTARFRFRDIVLAHFVFVVVYLIPGVWIFIFSRGLAPQ